MHGPTSLTLVNEGHGLRLFRLEGGSGRAWRLYLLEGSDPQAMAMMQALYSRSPKSVEEHFKVVCERGPEKFMAQYYVGYGHKSIGDCGAGSVVFIEGLPMCAAKAVQDHPLYRGQEASTRYLDMSAQPVWNPIGTPEGARIQDAWMSFYRRASEPLKADLRVRFPRRDGEPEKEYEKAIGARSFDILRAFLPVGTSTFVAWSSDLRQFGDKVARLRVDADPVNRDLGEDLFALLSGRYASSFSARNDPERDAWRALALAAHDDLPTDTPWPPVGETDVRFLGNRPVLDHLLPVLATRPPREELPPNFALVGSFQMRGDLDYGSFRDLQRHRAVRIPLFFPDPELGFHPWYLGELSPGLRAEAEALIAAQTDAVLRLGLPPHVQQYYLPMGMRVPVAIDGPLPAVFYLLELRSGADVHPTLRRLTQQLATRARDLIPGVALHVNMEPDAWSLNRAKHDIVDRQTGESVGKGT